MIAYAAVAVAARRCEVSRAAIEEVIAEADPKTASEATDAECGHKAARRLGAPEPSQPPKTA